MTVLLAVSLYVMHITGFQIIELIHILVNFLIFKSTSTDLMVKRLLNIRTQSYAICLMIWTHMGRRQ